MTSESPKDVTDYYKHLSLFWTDIIHLMLSKPQALTSIGPMRAFASNSKKISNELIEANEVLMEFNQYLTEEDLSLCLSEAYRVIRPGGVVAIKEVDASIMQYQPLDPVLVQHLFEAGRGQCRWYLLL